MKPFFSCPEIVGAATGALVVAFFLSAAWQPVRAAFDEQAIWEKQLLLESFLPGIAKAFSEGDDLGWVDLLRRLEKMPGVESVQFDPQGGPAGRVELKMSGLRQRAWRFRYGERTGALMVAGALGGGALGIGLRRRRRAHVKRCRFILKRGRLRHQRRLRRLQEGLEKKWLGWMRQALVFAPEGVVLLDGRQHVVAFNRKAEDLWEPIGTVRGRHWLDLDPSPVWAAALRETLNQPGRPVSGPALRGRRISLLTFVGEDQSPDSTWLFAHSEHI